MCNHPDLFEARQIDSPFVLPALELSVGSRILRSRLEFPTSIGRIETGRDSGVRDSGGSGACVDEGGGGDGAKVWRMVGGVSRRLVTPLWAHDVSGNKESRVPLFVRIALWYSNPYYTHVLVWEGCEKCHLRFMKRGGQQVRFATCEPVIIASARVVFLMYTWYHIGVDESSCRAVGYPQSHFISTGQRIAFPGA